MEEKKMTCSNCETELSNNDKVYVDNDGYTYCSKHCLLDSNLEEETTVQGYIDEIEPSERDN